MSNEVLSLQLYINLHDTGDWKKVKVKLSCKKLWRFRRGMEFWASTLTWHSAQVGQHHRCQMYALAALCCQGTSLVLISVRDSGDAGSNIYIYIYTQNFNNILWWKYSKYSILNQSVSVVNDWLQTTIMLNFNQCLLKLYYSSHTYKGFKYKYFHLTQMIGCCDIFIIIIICLLKSSAFIS